MANNPNVQPIVNRGDPVPTLVVHDNDAASTGSATPVEEGPSTSGRRRLSFGYFRSRSNSDASEKPGLQDKMFSALFSQIFPEARDYEAQTPKGAKRTNSKVSLEKTPFSLPTMSRNFRRFNARIGVVFAFQDNAAALFSWQQPSHTLSFLAVYSFCCLNPNIIIALPLIICVLAIMVPAFVARHPPPPNSTPADIFNTAGPASAPPPSIKPAPEMSKDFFRNMRDLQNSMEDFSVIHDQLISVVGSITNFSNERLSSSVFAILFITSCALFISANLLPWRAIFLVLGWVAILSAHPLAVEYLASSVDQKAVAKEQGILLQQFNAWSEKDIAVDEEPAKREVEVFELQRLRDSHWEPWLYSPTPYDPLSPSRIAGDRPRGSRFFEDVLAPAGWDWGSKKWTLDLFSREWVEDRMIASVEVETEGERWVYDLGGSWESQPVLPQKAGPDASQDKARGEWRRRRWIRLVKRKTV